MPKQDTQNKRADNIGRADKSKGRDFKKEEELTNLGLNQEAQTFYRAAYDKAIPYTEEKKKKLKESSRARAQGKNDKKTMKPPKTEQELKELKYTARQIRDYQKAYQSAQSAGETKEQSRRNVAVTYLAKGDKRNGREKTPEELRDLNYDAAAIAVYEKTFKNTTEKTPEKIARNKLKNRTINLARFHKSSGKTALSDDELKAKGYDSEQIECYRKFYQRYKIRPMEENVIHVAKNAAIVNYKNNNQTLTPSAINFKEKELQGKYGELVELYKKTYIETLNKLNEDKLVAASIVTDKQTLSAASNSESFFNKREKRKEDTAAIEPNKRSKTYPKSVEELTKYFSLESASPQSEDSEISSDEEMTGVENSADANIPTQN